MPSEDLQLSFGSFTCGKSTPYRIKEISGLEDFSVRSQDDTTASRWGSLISADEAGAATIVIEFIFPNDPNTILALEQAFLPASQSAPSTLTPLMWKWPGKNSRLRMARCRRRSRPMTVESERPGGAVSMFVELHAPDPRIYSADLHTASVPAFGGDGLGVELSVGSGTGLGVDLSVGSGTGLGIDFSGTSGGGTVFCVNAGTVESWPAVTFVAPLGMNSWRLTNITTNEAGSFQFPVSGPQQFVVDWSIVATPAIGDAVTLDGAARYSAWQRPRIPVSVAPGYNEFRFDVLDGDDTNAYALIGYHDAWL